MKAKDCTDNERIASITGNAACPVEKTEMTQLQMTRHVEGSKESMTEATPKNMSSI